MSVLDDVAAELDRQNVLWGVQDHEPATWLAILTEEAGEVAKEIADAGTDARAFNPRQYRTELIQVAAVAVAAVQSLDRKDVHDVHESGGERSLPGEGSMMSPPPPGF
jgi:NTP pyrophosphatase (non-canonical NTP hydrolase)